MHPAAPQTSVGADSISARGPAASQGLREGHATPLQTVANAQPNGTAPTIRVAVGGMPASRRGGRAFFGVFAKIRGGGLNFRLRMV